jgi:hypothetical protein
MRNTAGSAKRVPPKRERMPSGFRPPRPASVAFAVACLEEGIQKARKALTDKQSFSAQLRQDRTVVAALGIVAAREVRSANDTALYSTSPVLSPVKLFSESYRTESRRLSKPKTHRSQ